MCFSWASWVIPCCKIHVENDHWIIDPSYPVVQSLASKDGGPRYKLVYTCLYWRAIEVIGTNWAVFIICESRNASPARTSGLLAFPCHPEALQQDNVEFMAHGSADGWTITNQPNRYLCIYIIIYICIIIYILLYIYYYIYIIIYIGVSFRYFKMSLFCHKWFAVLANFLARLAIVEWNLVWWLRGWSVSQNWGTDTASFFRRWSVWFNRLVERHVESGTPPYVMGKKKTSGWWFQTVFIFHFIYGMSSQPHWRTHIFFRDG